MYYIVKIFYKNNPASMRTRSYISYGTDEREAIDKVKEKEDITTENVLIEATPVSNLDIPFLLQSISCGT
jgi:hypothetical protein